MKLVCLGFDSKNARTPGEWMEYFDLDRLRKPAGLRIGLARGSDANVALIQVRTIMITLRTERLASAPVLVFGAGLGFGLVECTSNNSTVNSSNLAVLRLPRRRRR